MDIERVLLFRHDFLVSKKMFEKDPEWTSGAGFANWKLYGTFKTEYANARKVFLERRRHERTAAALAAAEAEVARLRVALREINSQLDNVNFEVLIQITSMSTSPKWQDITETHSIDDIMSFLYRLRNNLTKVRECTVPDKALNPDANHENG